MLGKNWRKVLAKADSGGAKLATEGHTNGYKLGNNWQPTESVQ